MLSGIIVTRRHKLAFLRFILPVVLIRARGNANSCRFFWRKFMPTKKIQCLHQRVRDVITETITVVPKDETIAIPLSGGIDSNSVLLSAIEANRNVHAFVFYLNEDSKDLMAARHNAHQLNIPITEIKIPSNIETLSEDLLTLHSVYGAIKKTDYECGLPLLYLYKAVADAGLKYIAMGLEAEYYFDNLMRMDGRKSQRKFAYENPLDRAQVIQTMLENGEMCGQQKIHDLLCEEYEIQLIAPYISQAMLNTFIELSLIEVPMTATEPPATPWKHSGLNKRATRRAYREDIEKYDLIINKAANYQVESGIREYLAEKLLNSEWNLRDSRSTSAVYNSINKGLIKEPLRLKPNF